MSKFLSVHNIVFGGRGGIWGGPDDDFLFKTFPDEKPIAVTRVVCAIEMCTTYNYDKFGRFCVANDEAKEKIKEVLAKYYSEIPFAGDLDQLDDSYNSLLLPPADVLVWIGIGWLEDDLPDFEACYQQWKADNGMAGKSVPPSPVRNLDPYPQSHIWKLMSQVLKLSVGDEAHQLIKKDDYKAVISTLEDKGLRWAENEKKALRRHLKTIVTNAQQ
jgi:hypothetical protein